MQTIHSQDNEYFIKKTPKLFIFEIGTIQRGAVKKFFRRCLRKNLNCRQYINGKHMIFSENKNSDILRNIHDQNHSVGCMRLPITASSNKP